LPGRHENATSSGRRPAAHFRPAWRDGPARRPGGFLRVAVPVELAAASAFAAAAFIAIRRARAGR
jgi:hypothetical protein